MSPIVECRASGGNERGMEMSERKSVCPHLERHFRELIKDGHVEHQAPQQVLQHGRADVPGRTFSGRWALTWKPTPPHPAAPPGPSSRLLAERHEAVLDDVTLRFGEGAAPGQAVHGVQHGVHHDGAVLGSGKERRTLGDERQNRQAQVSVQRQRHLSSAERGLECRVGT